MSASAVKLRKNKNLGKIPAAKLVKAIKINEIIEFAQEKHETTDKKLVEIVKMCMGKKCNE